ncbi:MAG: hypothetical protein EXR51_06140 [Dehalococcoidia bacterium]|nr:hypothetical protein [Dehalococcoidia bacterium]
MSSVPVPSRQPYPAALVRRWLPAGIALLAFLVVLILGERPFRSMADGERRAEREAAAAQAVDAAERIARELRAGFAGNASPAAVVQLATERVELSCPSGLQCWLGLRTARDSASFGQIHLAAPPNDAVAVLIPTTLAPLALHVRPDRGWVTPPLAVLSTVLPLGVAVAFALLVLVGARGGPEPAEGAAAGRERAVGTTPPSWE